MARTITDISFGADDVTGAASLLEFAAMGRVAGLSLGGRLMGARVGQLERDADRARRQGDPKRAETLLAQAKEHRQLRARIADQTERETTRALVPGEKEAILQGRLTREGRGAGGLRVDLMSSTTEVFASDTSDANGAFVLHREGGISDNERIVVSDGKGGVFRTDPAPIVGPGRAGWVEMALDGFDPRDAGKPPVDDDLKDFVEVPRVLGMDVKEAVTVLKRARLTAATETEPAPGTKAGTVLKQKPSAGVAMRKGSEVLLIVAEGESKTMPDLRGATLEDLPGRLKEAGLTLGAIDLAAAPRQAGKVVGHVPAPDEPVAPEAPVIVRIGAGAAKADIATATLMIARDPRAVEMKLTSEQIAATFKEAKVTNAEKLRAFAAQSAGEVAKALGVTERGRAARAQALVTEVAARFPKE